MASPQMRHTDVLISLIVSQLIVYDCPLSLAYHLFSGFYSTLSLSVGVVSNRQPKNFGYLRYHTMLNGVVHTNRCTGHSRVLKPYKSWIASSV